MPSSHEPPKGGKIPIRPALRLVTNEAPVRKKREPPPPLFTAEQTRLLKASLKTARGLFGSWSCLAAAMYSSKVNVQHVAGGRGRVTATVALRLARALGVPLETLITPGLRLVPFPKVCPACGRAQS